MTNPWVGYIDRAYEQIKQSLLDRLAISNPEISDRSESNPLIIIISMFAGVVEMLGLYIDTLARESFLPTARRYSSVVKLTRLIDYRVKAASIATADLTIDYGQPLSTFYILPPGTQFQSNTGIIFTMPSAVAWNPGEQIKNVGVEQSTTITNGLLGTSNGSQNQQVSLGTNYVQDSLSTTVNGILFTRVDTFGLALPSDKVFITDVNEQGIAFVQFGDGINGMIPPIGYSILGTYKTTQGADGNLLPNSIISFVTPPTLPLGITIPPSIYNLNPSSGGKGYDTIDDIRKLAPLSLRTLNREVTFQDYKDYALLAPGVKYDDICYCCGKCITLYIAPVGGGIASSALLKSTADFVCKAKMITTCINVQAAGITPVLLEVTATTKFLQDTVLAQQDVVNAIFSNYGYDNSDVNRQIYLSDIEALLDNLDRIDHLKITRFVTQPYARPINGLITPLNWNTVTTDTCTGKHKYTITDYGVPGFAIFKDSNYVGTFAVGSTYSDDDITFTILAGPYVIGDTWVAYTYPSLQDLLLDNFTVPVVSVTPTINGNIGLNCRPNC